MFYWHKQVKTDSVRFHLHLAGDESQPRYQFACRKKKQLLYRKQINQSECTKSPHLVSQTIGNQALLDGSDSSIHHVRGGDDVTACTVKENHTGLHFTKSTRKHNAAKKWQLESQKYNNPSSSAGAINPRQTFIQAANLHRKIKCIKK